MKWWTDLQHAYARKYVCPFWGHKPSGIGDFELESDRNSNLAVVGRISDRCQNCGEVIIDAQDVQD